MTFVPVKTIEEVLAVALPASEAPPAAELPMPEGTADSTPLPDAAEADEPAPVAVRDADPAAS
jgi:hypothetical protein